MKALTVRQPWASLIALDVKRIETRSWRTHYRGPLAIHAGKARVPKCSRCAGFGSVQVGAFDVDCCPECGGSGRFEPHDAIIGCSDDLPLGAVVATCTLADCLPISDDHISAADHVKNWRDIKLGLTCHIGFSDLGVFGSRIPTSKTDDISDQLPYGDWSPGRWAWQLDDIEPLDEPVPARGRQGLWEWTR